MERLPHGPVQPRQSLVWGDALQLPSRGVQAGASPPIMLCFLWELTCSVRHEDSSLLCVPISPGVPCCICTRFIPLPPPSARLYLACVQSGLSRRGSDRLTQACSSALHCPTGAEDGTLASAGPGPDPHGESMRGSRAQAREI